MNFINFGPNQNDITNEDKKPSEELQEKRKAELEDFSILVLEGVIDDLTFTPDKNSPEDLKILDEQILETMNALAVKNGKHLLQGDKLKVSKLVKDEILAYGPITSFLDDPSVTEVMVNGPDMVFIERFGKIEKTNKVFRNNQHVLHTIDKIVAPIGRRVDESSPMVDART